VPMMERMKAIGLSLSIDDFGTGYSNMSYLRRFPIDRLKLDISFVREITTDPGSLAITDAVITMAHSLHLEVVAEGVETEGQLTLLGSRHCDIVQGYYFSKPLPAAELEAFLRAGRSLPANLTSHGSDAPMVLVLDDDTMLLEYLSLVLSNEGYDVQATSDPLRAFEMLACAEYAVVLCDQRMPAMDGIEFLSRVKGLYPDTIRIVHSAYDDALVTREAINRGGVYKFVDKSEDSGELVHVVKDAFEIYASQRRAKLQSL
jgi:CheY-like chemotaxis protein